MDKSPEPTTVGFIITHFLTRIPAKLRLGMLLAFALVVIGTQIAEAFSADIHEGVYRTLGILGAYLGVQSAANVPTEDE